MVLGTRLRMAALNRCNQHKDQCDKVKTIRDALKAVHCKPVGTPAHDMFHINCAFNHCPSCPELKQPTQEKNCEDPIAFQTHELVDYCTEHSTSPTGLQVCPVCAQRREGEKKGTVKSRRQLIHKRLPFSEIYINHYMKNLMNFKRHSFLFSILSKSRDRKFFWRKSCTCLFKYLYRFFRRTEEEVKYLSIEPVIHGIM